MLRENLHPGKPSNHSRGASSVVFPAVQIEVLPPSHGHILRNCAQKLRRCFLQRFRDQGGQLIPAGVVSGSLRDFRLELCSPRVCSHLFRDRDGSLLFHHVLDIICCGSNATCTFSRWEDRRGLRSRLLFLLISFFLNSCGPDIYATFAEYLFNIPEHPSVTEAENFRLSQAQVLLRKDHHAPGPDVNVRHAPHRRDMLIPGRGQRTQSSFRIKFVVLHLAPFWDQMLPQNLSQPFFGHTLAIHKHKPGPHPCPCARGEWGCRGGRVRARALDRGGGRFALQNHGALLFQRGASRRDNGKSLGMKEARQHIQLVSVGDQPDRGRGV
eukprot:RCo033802